jgi:hypothetical protein
MVERVLQPSVMAHLSEHRDAERVLDGLARKARAAMSGHDSK